MSPGSIPTHGKIYNINIYTVLSVIITINIEILYESVLTVGGLDQFFDRIIFALRINRAVHFHNNITNGIVLDCI